MHGVQLNLHPIGFGVFRNDVDRTYASSIRLTSSTPVAALLNLTIILLDRRSTCTELLVLGYTVLQYSRQGCDVPRCSIFNTTWFPINTVSTVLLPVFAALAKCAGDGNCTGQQPNAQNSRCFVFWVDTTGITPLSPFILFYHNS